MLVQEWEPRLNTGSVVDSRQELNLLNVAHDIGIDNTGTVYTTQKVEQLKVTVQEAE